MVHEIIMTELKEIRNMLDSMCVRQQFNSEIVRKSANSINVIVRLLAGVMHLSTKELSNTLIKADALLHMAKSFEDSNFKPVDFSSHEYPINHFKALLLNLLKVIDTNEQNARLLSPIHIPSTSSQIISIPADTISEAHNTNNNHNIPNEPIAHQNINKPTTATRQMSPDITQNTYYSVYNIQKDLQNLQKIIDEPTAATISKIHSSPDITQRISSMIHNDNISVPTQQETINEQTATVSKIHMSPDITQNTSSRGYNNMAVPNVLLSKQDNCIPSGQLCSELITQISDDITTQASIDKRKETEYELRRKYRNKYKYLNITNKVLPEKKEKEQATENKEQNQPADNIKKRIIIIPKCIFQDQIIKNSISLSEPRVILHRYNPNEKIEQKINEEPKKQQKSAKPKKTKKLAKGKKAKTLHKEEESDQKSNNKVNSVESNSHMTLRRSNITKNEHEPVLKKKRPNK